MPIYEYRCDDCGNLFEKLVRRPEDSSSLACPSCGQSRLSLQLSVFAAPSSSPAKRSEAPPCAGGVCPRPICAA